MPGPVRGGRDAPWLLHGERVLCATPVAHHGACEAAAAWVRLGTVLFHLRLRFPLA